jgi:hypothetical protein
MPEISEKDAVKVAKWLGPDIVRVEWVNGTANSECDGMLLPTSHWLLSPPGQDAIMYKALKDYGYITFDVNKPRNKCRVQTGNAQCRAPTRQVALIKTVLKMI